MSELSEAIWDALDEAHDSARHVHAAECCWSFPGAMAAIDDALAARAADRDAGLRERIEAAVDDLTDLRPHIPPSTASDRRDCIVMRDTLNRAIRKIRAALDAPAGTPTGRENGAGS